ncbi:MAG: ATP-binding protein [Gemmatimonadales bacterium]|jgi:chromosomal replication initiation ATPase DnaA|nr:ATP-binding protein [Gemmatimonadales bacterium]MBP9199464.1 ATP-binding protein [Gemmatimonadales bacterium]
MPRLNPRNRFDSYVVGSANRLAVTAARAVAESPGAVYNPLFIYAGSGLGKTHLLMALGHSALEVNPSITVEYLTLDEFIESFNAAIAQGQGEAYRRRYADVGVLLVDDVQFLTHRREMQAELLRLTNTMLTSGRQIVLSSDRPPNEIAALDERLIQRFAGGLVIDISAPDYETRVAILRRQAEERKATFDASVLEAVATLPIGSIRELIGAFNRLIAYQAVQPGPISSVEAREVLARSMPLTLRAATPAAESATVVGSGDLSAPAAEAEAPGALLTGDEFGAFLSEISSAVARQVEAWRGRVAEAILRWQGEGYRTERLERLLEGEAPVDPDAALQDYEDDIERLKVLELEARELDAQVANLPVFHDPDRMEDAREEVARAREGLSPPPGPSPIWRVEEFVESGSNREVTQAARAVLEAPGEAWNPLVVFGPVGVGKTHLLHGIGNVLAAMPGMVVACQRAEDFVDELIKAIDRDRVAWWRARYRRVTAFLLDDVHLLVGKDRTQEELFWLYNQLADQGRQMVFTSQVPPQELAGLEDRLRTRLEAGLVVALPAPDREVREAIITRLLRERLGEAEPELSAYLADRPVDTVRGLQELVQRVLEAAETERARPSAGLARQVLEGSPAAPARRTTGTRTSGLLSPTGSLRSREKMVWDWPDIADRLIEDQR